jgi:hypothetical protein
MDHSSRTLLGVDDDEEHRRRADRNTNRLGGERRVVGREGGVAHAVPNGQVIEQTEVRRAYVG